MVLRYAMCAGSLVLSARFFGSVPPLQLTPAAVTRLETLGVILASPAAAKSFIPDWDLCLFVTTAAVAPSTFPKLNTALVTALASVSADSASITTRILNQKAMAWKRR